MSTESRTGDRPSLAPAIISGCCAVAVAMITGGFNWINRSSSSAPPPTPTLIVTSPITTPQQTASLDDAPAERRPVRRTNESAAALNFASFQATVKDNSLTEEVHQRAIDRLQGKIVIWQGYVDAVNRLTPETGDAWMVVLCEDEETLSQSLFKRPALCRFAADPDGAVSQVRRGQRVTLSGEFSEHSALGTTLRNCALLQVHED